jgi:hypothetical protein
VTRSLLCSLAQLLGIYFLFCVNLLNVSQATMFLLGEDTHHNLH